MAHILIIDNHDSFVYNLVQLVREAKESCLFTLVQARDLASVHVNEYDGLLVSPGPGLPEDFPLMMQILGEFIEAEKPVLGICLGCQAIASYFGYGLRQLQSPLHGHTSYLKHSGKGILQGIEQNTAIGRYHSWVVDLDNRLQATRENEHYLVEQAYTEDIDGRHCMVISHIALPVWGILFHPESIISEQGELYIRNWLRLCFKK